MPSAAALLEAAYEATADALLIVDRDQRIQRVNRAAVILTGWTAEAALGQLWPNVLQLTHGDPRDAARKSFDAPVAGMHRIALRARDGTLKRALLRFEAFPGGTVLTLRPHDALVELEEALNQSERRLAIALEGGKVGLWEWDARSDTLREFGYWVGRTRQTQDTNVISGEVVVRHTHPDDVAGIQAAVREHLRGHTAYYEVEQRIELLTGDYVRFLVRGQVAQRDADGRAAQVIGTYTDITELRERERLLRFALESSQQGIWEWQIATDQITEHHFWRPQLENYHIPSPIAGRMLSSYTHPDDLPPLRHALKRYLRGSSEGLELELRLRRTDGSFGSFLIRGRALERNAHGRCERIIGTYTEITALKANERVLQLALENGRQALWDWHPQIDHVTFSREWTAMLGHSDRIFASHRQSIANLLHPDDFAPGRAALLPMLRGECEDFQIEHRFRHHDGHYLYILSRGRVLERDRHGRAVRVVGTHVDITALKDAEQRLLESRNLLETVIDAFPMRVFWKDRDSHYLGCNRAFARDVGHPSAHSVIGLSDDDLPWRLSADQMRADDQRIVSGARERVTTERLLTPAVGEPLWAETTKVPIRDGAGDIQGVVGLFDDITRRRAHEQQLRVIANALTSGHQDRLLNAVTRAAAELAEADYAFISRINDDGTATVSACYPINDAFKGQTYDLAGTPCAGAIAGNGCFIAAGAAAQYPTDHMLTARHIEGYVGQPLATSDGHTVGLFTLFFTLPIAAAERVRPVIDIFAARAINELERERTHTDLYTSEQRLNAAIEGANQGLWEWRVASDELTIYGSRFTRLHGSTGAPLRASSSLLEVVHPDDRDRLRLALRRYLSGTATDYAVEVRMHDVDGEHVWVLVRGRASARAANGRIEQMIGTYTDISDLKASQAALESSQQFQELIIDTVPLAIFWQDRDFRYIGANRRYAELAGVNDPDELIGRTDRELWWADQTAQFIAQDLPLLDGDVTVLTHETRIVTPLGVQRWVELIKVPMLDGAGNIIGILGTLHDVSVRKQAEDNAQRLSLYDPLTNLPNRRYFSERLESSLAAALRHGNCGALLFIDMDQFKRINDTLGHSVGDALLQAVAGRLQNVTRQDDMVARLGGDEFVVLLPDLDPTMAQAAHLARAVAEKIHETLGHPFQFEHHQFHVTPTIGIALFPEPGKGVDDVLKEADTAMYSGKAAGRNVTRFFQPQMEESAQQRLAIESDLRVALKRNQLRLVFQPQVDSHGRLSGAEALLRWHHPERGVIGPTDFIPVAEERGLIVEIGRWVLEASFAAFHRWMSAGIAAPGELAINVSSRQFRDDHFVTDVEDLLARYAIPPGRIVFEITESTVIEDVDATIRIMAQLRRRGLRFALDDFGVGYSSLSYLKRLPIDQLKIDRSFIADIGTDQNDEVICQTIVAMGRHLELQTVAEGVETQAQFEFLQRIDCNRYQGYLFLVPADEHAFLHYCATTTRS